MEINLTKDAKGTLAIIYKAYEKKRRSGIRKSQASYFDFDSEFPNADDMRDNIPELKNAGLISCDIAGGVLLKDAAIIYMENKTPEAIKE